MSESLSQQIADGEDFARTYKTEILPLIQRTRELERLLEAAEQRVAALVAYVTSLRSEFASLANIAEKQDRPISVHQSAFEKWRDEADEVLNTNGGVDTRVAALEQELVNAQLALEHHPVFAERDALEQENARLRKVLTNDLRDWKAVNKILEDDGYHPYNLAVKEIEAALAAAPQEVGE